jgi:hypothetical protein
VDALNVSSSIAQFPDVPNVADADGAPVDAVSRVATPKYEPDPECRLWPIWPNVPHDEIPLVAFPDWTMATASSLAWARVPPAVADADVPDPLPVPDWSSALEEATPEQPITRTFEVAAVVADQWTVTVSVDTSVKAGFRHSYTQQDWPMLGTNDPFVAGVYVFPRLSVTLEGLTEVDDMPMSTNSEFPAAGIVVASEFASVPAVTTVVDTPDAWALDPMLNGLPSATAPPPSAGVAAARQERSGKGRPGG